MPTLAVLLSLFGHRLSSSSTIALAKVLLVVPYHVTPHLDINPQSTQHRLGSFVVGSVGIVGRLLCGPTQQTQVSFPVDLQETSVTGPTARPTGSAGGTASKLVRIQRADFIDLICRSRRIAEDRSGCCSDQTRLQVAPCLDVYLDLER